MTKNEIDIVKRCIGVTVPQHITAATWQDLRDLRAQLREGSKALLDKVEADNRDLTPEERSASDAALQVLQTVQDEIESRLAENRKGPRLMDEPLRPIGTNQRRGTMESKLFAPRKRWADVFGREPRNVEGLENFGQVVVALHRGDTEKIRELRTLNTITGSEGGFATPEIWWSQVYDSGVEASVALDKVTTFPMTGDTLYVPAWDSADHTGGPIGAVEGQWLGETQTATRRTPNLRLVKFSAYKLAMFIAVSSEALQDSSALGQSIAPLMRNSLAFSLDEAILTGSGVGEPQGIIGSGATIAQPRASATDINFADLVGMKGRIIPSSLDRAVWLVSPSAFAVLAGLVVTAGTGVLAMGYMHGASDIRMSILGHPVRVTEKLPALGEKGDVMLCDLSYYGLAMRETARFERTNSAQWTEDIIDMRFVLRCDGKPLIAAPFTPAGGGNSLSPFVCLDA